MGGSVKVKSEEGIGSKFKFCVKLNQVSEFDELDYMSETSILPNDYHINRVKSLKENMTLMQSETAFKSKDTSLVFSEEMKSPLHEKQMSKIDFNVLPLECEGCKQILVIDDNSLNIFAL
eukprot:CAMPEP_0170550234 /NCGR_PEP_ID=MMETSP0211-20121228/8307_1 /TAXON_ID=311385 /ORGANISM="Pseudokeronopsis sp., Strain OXSARD2" /LENGTH=119 /DNA_ID=CAMNT_0010856671 /DNA_START=786 /DNA_END=1145 /DNA_ORIENTATION=+